MKQINQANFIRSYAKVSLFLLLLGAIFLSEPLFRDKLTFAITYFDQPKITSGENLTPNFAHNSTVVAQPRQKSHAPEPSTMFLVLSGLCGLVVRAARISFQRFKRYLDLLLAAFGLTVALPILVFVAILIKLTSKGPIIYRQNRVGQNGSIFRIYKLRTMRVDAEKATGAVWAKKNDTRITPVGSILRKIHIDEIPQLFNVIKGEMSIVGPRPERPEMVRDLKTLICDYEKRLQIKPGITGLAQVRHKYDETIADVKKKIKYDIFYIKKMCWLVEMRILAQTFVVMLTGRGAR